MSKFENPAVPRRGFLFAQRRVALSGVLMFLFGTFAVSIAAAESVTFQDKEGRYTFDYPKDWGLVSQGTNDGYGNRVASHRFSSFTPGRLGGEAVLTKSRVMLDIQALGGLYDPITLEALPDKLRKTVLKILPAPTKSNFCHLLRQETHLNPDHPLLKQRPKGLVKALVDLDHTRNLKPKIIQCQAKGDTITFHKEATFVAGRNKTRQHIYGAIRFLKGKYSSFQLVQGGLEPPNPDVLKEIASVVRSFRAN